LLTLLQDRELNTIFAVSYLYESVFPRRSYTARSSSTPRSQSLTKAPLVHLSFGRPEHFRALRHGSSCTALLDHPPVIGHFPRDVAAFSKVRLTIHLLPPLIESTSQLYLLLAPEQRALFAMSGNVWTQKTIRRLRKLISDSACESTGTEMAHDLMVDAL
jgi:hypothetical protein